MNPEKPSREEIEAKLTALLLGELPAEEARLLRWAISQDAALAKLHDRLKVTIGFVREVAANPAETTVAQSAPLKLSDERREKLFAHFKTVRPVILLPPLPPKRREVSSFLVMAAAVALIAVLAAMLLPSLSSAKRRAQSVQMALVQSARAPAPPEVADILNQEEAAKTQKALAENQNNPPAASERRLESAEAQFQNGDTTAANKGINDNWTVNFALANPSGAKEALTQNGGDAWKNQTPIVLPAGGTDDKELAAASPAPSELTGMVFSGGTVTSDQNVYTVHTANANPSEVAGVLQNMFQNGNGSRSSAGSVSAETAQQAREQDSFTVPNKAQAVGGNYLGLNTSGSENNSGGGGAAGNFQQRLQSVIQRANSETGETVPLAGVAGDAKLTGFDFYTSKLDAAQNQTDSADKVPMLGDLPLMGNLFASSSKANQAANSWGSSGGSIQAPVVNPDGSIQSPVDIGGVSGAMVFDDSSKGTATASANWDLNGNTSSYGEIPQNQVAQNAATQERIKIRGNLANQNRSNIKQGYVASGMPPPASDGYNLDSIGLNISSPAPTGVPIEDRGSNPSYAHNINELENNGAVETTTITADAETTNLVVIADTATEDQIQNTLKNLDREPPRAPAAAMPPPPVVAQNTVVGQTEIHSYRAFDSVAPLSTVAPPAPVTSATVAGYVNMTNGIVLNQESKSELQPTATLGTSTFFLARKAQLGVDVYDQRQAQSQPPIAASSYEDRPLLKTPAPAPVPQPEFLTGENNVSTFSMNVSDVSFKLAAASLEKGQLPDAASIRSEEFINAFDYHDPEPLAGVPVTFISERARDPFTQNRDLLRFSIKTAAAGRQPGRPLNIVLLLDDSGSMERADRVAIIHEALKVLASQLQPQDTLSIVTFARTARLWVDGARGDQAGTVVNEVSNLIPEGGTNLEDGMNLAYATARRHYLANGGNRVVLLTDGAANLGNVDPEALKQKVETFRKQGIALDCFGIGWEGYNDDLLEVLSSNGDGRYGFVNTPEAATTEFAAQLAGALHVAAEDVKVQVEFNPQRVISWRQIGYAKHQLTKEQFRDNTVAAAPMAAREAGNALYTVEVNPQGEGPVATVRVRFRIPGTTDVSEHEWEVPFDGTAPALENSSPAMRLAATAGAFSEWLASSPFAQEVTTDQLLNYLNGVPAIYGADPRPKQLETMIREAKSLSGK